MSEVTLALAPRKEVKVAWFWVDGSALFALGVAAGGVTTVAGMGGSLLMLAVLTLWVGPAQALLWSAPALLLGNAHRLLVFRREVPWSVMLPVLAGVVPVGVGAGLVTSLVPTRLLGGLVLTGLAVGTARAMGWRPLPSPKLGPLVGALGGLMGAAGGGAGAVVAPYLMARGLRGPAYVGALAGLGVGLHAARWLGYALGGAPEGLLWGLLLAGGVALGNVVGRALASWVPGPWSGGLALASLWVCGGMAALGMLTG